VSQIVLARVLGPELFGLFGYAFLTITSLALVVEMGLQSALVQIPILDNDIVATACGRLLLAGVAAALGVYLLSDAIALHVFSAPQAAPVLRAMAPALIVGGLIAVATAILSREIEFKVIQLSGLVSYVFGYLIVGVSAALYGLGVWSLVIAWHVQTITTCVAMFYLAPRSLAPGNPLRRLDIARFGTIVMATNMVNWVIDNGPHVAIGRWLGPSLLGQYTVANNLVKAPADHLVRNLQAVLFPLAARAQDNDTGLRRAYLTVISGVSVVSFPIFAFVALMSHAIVVALFGSTWVTAAEVLVPLSLAMIGHAAEALCGPILGGRGEPRVELRIKVVTLVVMLTALSLTVFWSLAAVAWGVALVYLFRWIWMNAAVMKRLGVSFRDFGMAMRGPTALAIVCWAVTTGMDAMLSNRVAVVPPFWLLLMAAGYCFLAILVALLAVPHVVLGPWLLALVNRLMKQRPAIARIPGLRRLSVLAERFGA
jgi:PST family polysaccharide transporter